MADLDAVEAECDNASRPRNLLASERTHNLGATREDRVAGLYYSLRRSAMIRARLGESRKANEFEAAAARVMAHLRAGEYEQAWQAGRDTP